MFDNDERIIVLAQRLRHRNGTVVVDSAFARDCTIEGDNFGGLLAVLRHGHLRTAREMRVKLQKDHSMSAQDANDLLEGLFDLNLITTNRRMPLTMEEISMNPSGVPLAPRTAEDMCLLHNDQKQVLDVALPEDATPLMKLLSARESVRVFMNEEISDQQASSLTRAGLEGWGMHRSVPSAGGLYACRVLTLVRRNGSYRAWDERNLPASRVMKMFVPYAPCERAPVYMVITADYEHATKKYGARGWRYAMLEAGHIAQNIELHALEHGLATCEIGAFAEASCIRVLKLSETEVPLIVVAGGYKAGSKVTSSGLVSAKLIAAYVGPTGIVNSFEVRRRDPNLFVDRYSVRARSAVPIAHRGKGMDMQVVGAESSTRELAVVKAIAEGVERFSTGWIPPPVKTGIMSDLGSVEIIHPHDLQRYAKQQPVPSRLATFNRRSIASWYAVRKWGGDAKAYVPGDFLFYPYGDDNKKLYCYATSNGVAAHTDIQMALWKATSELLERESLIAWWFSGSMPPRLPDTEMQYLEQYIRAWHAKGVELRFLDITTSIPSVCVVAIDRKRRSSIVSSASDYNLTNASAHACAEVLRGITELDEVARSKVPPKRVRSVEDHLRCFISGYAFDYVDAWSSGLKTGGISRFPKYADPELCLNWVVDKVGPLFYYEHALPKSTFRDQPLVVTRSIIPDVVSIKFGYGEQDLGLPRLCKLMRHCREVGVTTRRSVPKIHPLA
ncbi:MAG: YcaO-like family protein [Patescibacteria group bacterium]